MHAPGPVFTRPKIHPLAPPLKPLRLSNHFSHLLFLPLITGSFRGFFLPFSLRLLWRLLKYISTFFLFCTRSVYGRTRNDQKAGKVRKTIRLQRRQALWQTEDYFLNEKFYLKTLNPKETKWKHLLYISSRFFIDESS